MRPHPRRSPFAPVPFPLNFRRHASPHLCQFDVRPLAFPVLPLHPFFRFPFPNPRVDRPFLHGRASSTRSLLLNSPRRPPSSSPSPARASSRVVQNAFVAPASLCSACCVGYGWVGGRMGWGAGETKHWQKKSSSPSREARRSDVPPARAVDKVPPSRCLVESTAVCPCARRRDGGASRSQLHAVGARGVRRVSPVSGSPPRPFLPPARPSAARAAARLSPPTSLRGGGSSPATRAARAPWPQRAPAPAPFSGSLQGLDAADFQRRFCLSPPDRRSSPRGFSRWLLVTVAGAEAAEAAVAAASEVRWATLLGQRDG